LTRLNYSGVPNIGLAAACAMPAALVVVVTDVGELAHLYAIGVCGAITISVLGCVVNPRLGIAPPARIAMGAIGMVMLAIEATIIATRRDATLFAGAGVLGVLLVRRGVAMGRRGAPPEPPLPAPAAGWLAECTRPLPKIDPDRPRIMLAARG